MKHNLSKENFWNALYEKYPLGMKVFCDWIDQYKKENDWDELFNAVLLTQTVAGDMVIKAPKFHDLPLAMQIGIWIEFGIDRGGCQWEIEDLQTYDWKEDIEQMIKIIHEEEVFSA